MEVGASGTAGAVEKVSDHGSKIKKWGHRFVEEKELAQEEERGSSSKHPRAGGPWGRPRGLEKAANQREGRWQERKPSIIKSGKHEPQ